MFDICFNFSQLTPAYLARLKDWSKDIHKIPDIDDTAVKQYLLRSDEFTDQDVARRYKTSRAYQLRQGIHSMKIHHSPIPKFNNFIVIRAMCNPSQATSQDAVKVLFIILKASNAKPLGGYCTCTAGYATCVYIVLHCYSLVTSVEKMSSSALQTLIWLRTNYFTPLYL